MAADGTGGQSRSGTSFSKGGNSNSLTGSIPKGQSKVGTGSSRSSNASSNDGRVIEGQNLRGYVSGNASLPTPKDVTVAPDGTNRVRRV